MTRDIDLTSPQWTDLIFEGKNKEYGAYEMRNDSSNRHLKALIIITIVGLAAVYLPNLFKSDTSKDEVAVSGQTVDVNMTDFATKVIDVKIILPAAPVVLPRPTIEFVPPVVVKDNLVDPDHGMATQDALTESSAQIGLTTVEGPADGTGDPIPLPPVEKPVTEIFISVEQMPQFPGGEKELMSWLSRNIQYPPIAAEKGIQGRVVLRFVVRPDGSIDDVTVVKSLEPGCDKEAIRAVKSMPKWISGKQNGNPVSVYYNIPVQFRLQNR